MVDPDMQALVLEMATGLWKCGFSGDDAPRAVFPSIVGRPKNPGIMVGMDAKDCFVGDEAQAKRGILNLTVPVPDNSVKKIVYNDLEKMFHHSFYNELCVTPEEHPLMILGIPCMKKSDFAKLTSIMFETFNCPAYALVDATVSSMYASGRTTGLSVDCGHSVCLASPIFEGNPIQYGKVILEDDRENILHKENPRPRIGGKLITDTLIKLIKKAKRRIRGGVFAPPRENNKNCVFEITTSVEKELCQDIKERFCCLEISDPKRIKNDLNIDKKTKYYYPWTCYNNTRGEKMPEDGREDRERMKEYELPDGTFVDIGVERFEAAEILFRPKMIGYSLPGLHEIVKMSVEKCHPDLQEEMYKNIVLNGGTTMTENFRERLWLELLDIIPEESVRNILRIHAPDERKFSAWIGASILSSLSTYVDQWITKDDYDWYGSSITERKMQQASLYNDQTGFFSNYFWVKDLDEEERRLYCIEECFVGVRKRKKNEDQEEEEEEEQTFDDDDDDDVLEKEFSIKLLLDSSNNIDIRFKSFLLL